jgi:hypothetical protein
MREWIFAIIYLVFAVILLFSQELGFKFQFDEQYFWLTKVLGVLMAMMGLFRLYQEIKNKKDVK